MERVLNTRERPARSGVWRRLESLELLCRGQLVAMLYFCVALATILTLSHIVPPFEIPDEVNHLYKAESIAKGHVRPAIIEGHRGGEVDPAVLELVHVYDAHITKPTPVPPAMTVAAGAVHWSQNRAVLIFSNTAQYGPFFYLPQSAALALGSMLDLPVDTSYRAARLAGAVASILVASIAISLARWGRTLLVVVLLTPMYLFLTVSVSQDGLLVAVAALYAALLTRLWSPVPAAGGLTVNRVFLAALACVLMLALARLPYMLLSFLLIHPAGPGVSALWRRRGFLRGLATPLLAPALTIALGLFWLFWAHILGTRVSLDPAVDAGAQLKQLLAHPGHIPLIALNSWSAIKDTSAHVIGVLGWLSIMLHSWAYAVGWWAIALAAVATLLQRSGPSVGLAAGTWLCLLMVAGGIAFALYTTWTPVGGPGVEGMQGRYFTPLFCVGVLALPSLRMAIMAPPLGNRPRGLQLGAQAGDWITRAGACLAVAACTGMGLVLRHSVVIVRHAYLGV